MTRASARCKGTAWHEAMEAVRLQQQQLEVDRCRLHDWPEAQQEVKMRQAEANRLLNDLRTRLAEAEQPGMVAVETAAQAAMDGSFM